MNHEVFSPIIQTIFLASEHVVMVKEVAAITGGTSGLGRGFVERFTKDGYEVIPLIEIILIFKDFEGFLTQLVFR